MSDSIIKQETLDEIGRSQWVRDRLLDADPALRTSFEDYDGDGVVGDIDDFIEYYEKNHEIIEQNVPFFKWVAKMDPVVREVHNPIHDYLSLSAQVVPAADVEQTYRTLAEVIKGARVYATPYDSLESITELVKDELYREGITEGDDVFAFLLKGALYQFGVIEEEDGTLSLPLDDGSVARVNARTLYSTFYSDHARAQEKRGDLGDLEGARDFYAHARYLDPSIQSTHHRLGSVLLALGDNKRALHVYEDALSNDPQDATARAGHGTALFELEDYKGAEADLKKAVELDWYQARAHLGLGRLQHRKKNYRAARRHYTRAIKVDPASAVGYYWRAVAYDDAGMPKKAIRDFIRSIKRDRSSAEAFYGLALAQHDAGYLDYAYKNIHAAIRRDSSNAYIYKDLGYLQMDRKKPKGALWAFNRALEINPKLVSALIGRGNVRHSQDEYLKALADYERALAVVDSKDAKNKANIYRNMGFLYIDMSMPKLAYENFRNVTVNDPKNPRGWCELGDVLSKPEYKSKLASVAGTNVDLAALKAFSKAQELDKKYLKAYHGTAMAWLRLGKYKKALEHLNTCLEIDRHNADTLLIRSKVHSKLGNYGSASKDRMDACRIKPSLCEGK